MKLTNISMSTYLKNIENTQSPPAHIVLTWRNRLMVLNSLCITRNAHGLVWSSMMLIRPNKKFQLGNYSD